MTPFKETGDSSENTGAGQFPTNVVWKIDKRGEKISLKELWSLLLLAVVSAVDKRSKATGFDAWRILWFCREAVLQLCGSGGQAGEEKRVCPQAGFQQPFKGAFTLPPRGVIHKHANGHPIRRMRPLRY
ncbi:hypothetical protein [Pseudomonas panipatensis]|uniref:hypothetical protein n=1 Tax=Pseudomonas panipatensis TaxID=428992 RepID=UPI001113F69A|nr:hypothetical protein [Pseudomonas panipatensis]